MPNAESLKSGISPSGATISFRKSTTYLALLSKNSVSQECFAQKELSEALKILEEMGEVDIFIIPVKLEECNPMNEKLLEIQWIDLFPKNKYNNGINRILKIINPKNLY